MTSVIFCTVVLVCLNNFAFGFIQPTKSFLRPRALLQTSKVKLHASLNPLTFLLADGLDSETLGALGDVGELNDVRSSDYTIIYINCTCYLIMFLSQALDSAISASSNPGVSIVNKLISSPLVLAVPITAGLLFAFAVGYFIMSYGQGKDD